MAYLGIVVAIIFASVIFGHDRKQWSREITTGEPVYTISHKIGGEVYMLRFSLNHESAAIEQIKAWVDDPDLEFGIEHAMLFLSSMRVIKSVMSEIDYI